MVGAGIPSHCDAGVEGFAIDTGDGGYVFRGFEAAFDFETFHARADEIWDEIDGGEVLGGEEVAVLAEVLGHAIDYDFIGHAAGLGALAAVGGALAEAFGGEALAGVGDAQGSVHEDFDGCVRRGEFFDFLDG